jgi:glucose-6-phosphate dehydrogenase assembly protein OpcA
MNTQSPPIVSLSAPKDVSVTEIEQELHQIWQVYQPENQQQDIIAATKASTFTLVVYEPEPIQHMLAVLGFYDGPIDGIAGPAQAKAVKKAQKSYSLEATGKLDRQTMQQIKTAYDNHVKAADSYTAVVTSTGEIEERGYVVADAIANTNPRRIIALCPLPGEDQGVNAQVSAYCPMKKQSEHTLVCSEYITLQGSATALERNGESIASLTIPDLPRFLWWKGTPTPDRNLFQHLATTVNSVIFDSAAFNNVEVDLLELHKVINQGTTAIDLNWHRLGVWQELSAEAFDPPARRKDITEIDRVDINYEKGNPAQALMFLGWLASRLQWQALTYNWEGGDYDLRVIEFTNPDGRTVRAELAGMPVADVGEIPGDLMAIRLNSTNPNADCCTAICSEVAGCMQMEAGGGTQACRVEEVTATADRGAVDLLAEYLHRWGQEVLYEESMGVVAEMLNLKHNG